MPPPPNQPAAPRRRWLLLPCLLATVVLGLWSRHRPLPGFLAEYTGDALYAVAAFWLLALLWPAARGASLAASAWTLAAFVEASQCLDWGWLVALRATRPGALLLGQGFQVADLLAYAAGALAASAIDAALPRRREAR